MAEGSRPAIRASHCEARTRYKTMRRASSVSVHTAPGIMACKLALFTTALFLIIALSFAAPTEEKSAEASDDRSKDDLAASDLKTAASHWGGYGGHYGGWGGHYGGYYPQYSYWGWPSYSYGYGYGWPYGGYGGYGGYGHHGYWW